MDAVTTTEAGKVLGVSSRTIARACEKHGIGYKVNERMRLLTRDDIEKLRGLVSNQKGNPQFGDPEFSRKAIQARWDAAPKKKAAVPKKASPAKKKPNP